MISYVETMIKISEDFVHVVTYDAYKPGHLHVVVISPLWLLESRAGRQPIETTPPLSTDEVVEGARHEACIYPAVSPPSIGANC